MSQTPDAASPEQPDESLIRAHRDGDASAFGRLLDRYERPILTLAMRLLDDHGLAMDTAQEVFLAAWKKLPGWRPGATFKCWLYRVAVNCASAGRRRRRSTSDREQAVAAARDRSRAIEDPAGAVESREEAARVRSAIASLPDAQRECLAMRYDLGLDYAEISAILGISAGGARANVSNALSRLRDAIAGDASADGTA